MNRREALKAMGTMAAAVFVQPSKSVDRTAELETDLEIEQAAADAWFDEASDLSVAVAYWREQYEQARAELEAVTMLYANLQTEHEQMHDAYNSLIKELAIAKGYIQEIEQGHWYQGDWHTEDEWRAHLAEQEAGTLAEVLDAG